MNSLSTLGRSRRAFFVGLFTVTLFAVSAEADLITNGNFEQTLTSNSAEFGSRYPQQQVTGWTSTGYNFVFLPGTADTTGAASEDGAGLRLWGPGNGSANGLPASSPAGGNFLAMDGVYATGPISQTLSGLTPGAPLSVTFYFAGAQQYNYTGGTTEQFQVSFDGQDQYTPVLNNASHGFTGWQQQTFTFNTTHATATLSFLAQGTPTGVPPFTLLDGVSATQSAAPGVVPEPSAWALVLTGLGMSGFLLRRKRSGKA